MRGFGSRVAIVVSLVLALPLTGSAQEPPEGSLVLQDTSGDLRDFATDEPLEGPGYMDLTGLEVSVSGGRLTVRFDVAEAVPEAPDPVFTTVDYILHVDTDGDGFQNYHLAIGSEDGWQATLFDYDTVFDTPLGEAVVVEGSLLVSVLVSELGLPAEMRFQGLMEALDFPDPAGDPTDFTEWQDRVPDDEGEWRTFGESDVQPADDQVPAGPDASPAASPTSQPAPA